MTTTKDSYIGHTLAKRYHLIKLIGQGSMGRVYGAKDMLLGGVPVAVKFLSHTLLNKKMKDRFEREATTCAQLGHRSRHIVRVSDCGVDDEGVPFYVMEYLDGQSLSELISRQPLPLPRFLSLIRQICLGLQCAHQGIIIDGELCPIIHRDIKPSNIVISHDDTLGELATILDFGIAKLLHEDSGQTNCFMGTLAYSSPEQMEGRELDARSDIYSLGVMMFQMLTAKMPLIAEPLNFSGWYRTHRLQMPRSFEATNPSLKLPRSLENLVMSCLAKSPNDRPQTTADVIRELEPLENQYRPGVELGKRIGDVLAQKPIAPKLNTHLSENTPAIATWPSDKPIADIVFPQVLTTSRETLASVWVMLPQHEIERRLICARYNWFLFAPSPHPVVLWLTVLFSRIAEPRWLSCYLDLRTNQGQQIARLLAESGQYRVLLFAKESKRCISVMPATVPPSQCKLLMEWATVGISAPATSLYTVSKHRLKEELEKTKPNIVMKLESLYADLNYNSNSTTSSAIIN